MSPFPAPIDLYTFLVGMCLSGIGMLLILHLYNKIYGTPKINQKSLYLLAILIVIAGEILLRFIRHPIRPVDTPTVITALSLLLLFFYPKQTQKKWLYSMALYTIAAYLLNLYDLIVTPLPVKDPWIVMFVMHLIFWILLILIRQIDHGKDHRIPSALWALLFAITLFSLIAFSILKYHIMARENPYHLTVEIPVMLAFLFVNLSLFVFFDRFSALADQEREKTLLEQQVVLQNKHFKELEFTYQQMRSIHHDMKNYLRMAETIATKSVANKELLLFLKDTSDQVEMYHQIIHTGNPTLDSILNLKFEEWSRAEIKVEHEIHLPPDIHFTFQEATVILGNIMDNGTEACLLLPKAQRWIKFQISYTNHTLLIQMENATKNQSSIKDGLPISSKPKAELHGFGLKNIQKIIEEIGTMKITSTETSFFIQIVLYNR